MTLLFWLGLLSAACDSATSERAVANPTNGRAAPLGRLEDQERLAAGTHQFAFSAWAGPEIPVWLHVPSNVDVRRAPITIVMHGAGRDADRYVRQWVPHAETHGVVIVAPKFSKRAFPGALRYNLGHVFDEAGNTRDESSWSFSAIEPLFDAVQVAIGSVMNEYAMYGHSGGSQFIHRYLFYKPNARVSRYVLANAGWYTFPSLDVEYPYGLSNSGITEYELKDALAADVVVLLGSEDNDPNHDSLRQTLGAVAQGQHRVERGMRFFQVASQTAEENDWPFRWRLQIVEGVAHSNRGMAEAAIELVR